MKYLLSIFLVLALITTGCSQNKEGEMKSSKDQIKTEKENAQETLEMANVLVSDAKSKKV